MSPTHQDDPDKFKNQTNVTRLSGLIIFIYFAMVVFLAACTVLGDIPLPYPAAWTNLLNFVYYVLPYILAGLAGVMLRPFWPSFRNVFVGIIVIHLFYSFGIYMGHTYYLDRLEQQIRRHRLEKIKVLKADHQFWKEPNNNSAAQLRVTLQLDSTKLSPGHYAMTVGLSRRGQPLTDAQSNSYHFRIPETGGEMFQTTLLLEPRGLNLNSSGDLYDIDLKITREMLLDQKTRNFLHFSRWAAFFRTTNWEGEDTDLADHWVETHLIRRIDSFAGSFL